MESILKLTRDSKDCMKWDEKESIVLKEKWKTIDLPVFLKFG